MIEMCRLKHVIFIQTILSFVLSRKIFNIYISDVLRYLLINVILPAMLTRTHHTPVTLI